MVTAYAGFAAAIAEPARLWPGAPTEIRTGFWGCGAFAGNREVMVILQLLAARLAGVSRLRFYAFDDAGRDRFAARNRRARSRAEAGRAARRPDRADR